MTSRLTWRSGVDADRQALMTFECAEKGERSLRSRWKVTYPREWEYEVQSACRTLRPPLRPPRFLLLGFDSGGRLGAVSYRTEVSGPDQVHLELLAVANHHRRQADVFVGDDLVSATLDEIIDRALQDDLERVVVTAHVHASNKASRNLCERHEFERTGLADSGYEVWSAELYLDL